MFADAPVFRLSLKLVLMMLVVTMMPPALMVMMTTELMLMILRIHYRLNKHLVTILTFNEHRRPHLLHSRLLSLKWVVRLCVNA